MNFLGWLVKVDSANRKPTLKFSSIFVLLTSKVVPAKLWLVQISVIGCSLLLLYNARGLAFPDHIDSLGHGLDAFRIHEALVDGVDSLVGSDVALSLQKQRSRVQTVVGIEDGEPALGIAFDQSPADG